MQNVCIRYNEYKIPKNHCIKLSNLVPRVLSYPPYGARERETLGNAGHVSPRIWEITNKRFGGGAGKCEILSLQCVDRSVQPSNCVPDLILNAENNAQSPLTETA